MYEDIGKVPKWKRTMYVKKERWSSRQVNFLIENWDTMSDEKISEVLGKTLKSVRRKRERLELKKASGRGIVAAYAPKEKKEEIIQGKIEKAMTQQIPGVNTTE